MPIYGAIIGSDPRGLRKAQKCMWKKVGIGLSKQTCRSLNEFVKTVEEFFLLAKNKIIHKFSVHIFITFHNTAFFTFLCWYK